MKYKEGELPHSSSPIDPVRIAPSSKSTPHTTSKSKLEVPPRKTTFNIEQAMNMMRDNKDDGDEVEDNENMPTILDFASMQPSTSGFRPVLQSTGDNDIAPGVAKHINEGMKETTKGVKVKRKKRAMPPTIHFGNERLDEFAKKREAKEAKERQLVE